MEREFYPTDSVKSSASYNLSLASVASSLKTGFRSSATARSNAVFPLLFFAALSAPTDSSRSHSWARPYPVWGQEQGTGGLQGWCLAWLLSTAAEPAAPPPAAAQAPGPLLQGAGLRTCSIQQRRVAHAVARLQRGSCINQHLGDAGVVVACGGHVRVQTCVHMRMVNVYVCGGDCICTYVQVWVYVMERECALTLFACSWVCPAGTTLQPNPCTPAA